MHCNKRYSEHGNTCQNITNIDKDHCEFILILDFWPDAEVWGKKKHSRLLARLNSRQKIFLQPG